MRLNRTKSEIFAINRRIGTGVNLGNMLEAPSEGQWSAKLEAGTLQLIAERGFDSVRIPIRWAQHARAEIPYTINRLFMHRVTWAVDGALEQGLVTIINFHHYTEIYRDPDRHEQRFLAMWSQVAEHFKDYPQELVFEILNEPQGALNSERWNRLLAKALRVIRASNPDRAVMVGPGDFNNIMELRNLRLPEDDRALIVSVHYYLPFEFTHQGATWLKGAASWLGTTWPAGPGQRLKLHADLQVAARWMREHDRPLNLGEFGTIANADMQSRIEWTSSVAGAARALGFSLVYWAFTTNFGVYDPESESWVEPLVNALGFAGSGASCQRVPGAEREKGSEPG